MNADDLRHLQKLQRINRYLRSIKEWNEMEKERRVGWKERIDHARVKRGGLP
jgi:hypothetical protein